MTSARTAFLALAALLASTAAYAQNAYTEIDDSVPIPGMAMSADDIDDMDVRDASGNKIGDVEEVLGTNERTPTAVAVDFDDETLGGDEDRVVPLTALSAGSNGLVLSMDRAEIAKLPVYDD